MYCSNCGEEVPTDSAFCPYCGCQFNDANPSDTQYGYLSNIINDSFLPRFITGVTFSYIIFMILVMFFGFVLPAIITPTLYAEMMNGTNPTINNLGVTLGGIVTLLFLIFCWFVISRKGLSLTDKWLTPRYRRHLMKHKPNLSRNDIDHKAVKHLMIFANIFRIIGYIALFTVLIYVIFIGFVLWLCSLVLGIFVPMRTWHFFPRGILFPTHWY